MWPFLIFLSLPSSKHINSKGHSWDRKQKCFDSKSKRCQRQLPKREQCRTVRKANKILPSTQRREENPRREPDNWQAKRRTSDRPEGTNSYHCAIVQMNHTRIQRVWKQDMKRCSWEKPSPHHFMAAHTHTPKSLTQEHSKAMHPFTHWAAAKKISCSRML